MLMGSDIASNSRLVKQHFVRLLGTLQRLSCAGRATAINVIVVVIVSKPSPVSYTKKKPGSEPGQKQARGVYSCVVCVRGKSRKGGILLPSYAHAGLVQNAPNRQSPKSVSSQLLVCVFQNLSTVPLCLLKLHCFLRQISLDCLGALRTGDKYQMK